MLSVLERGERRERERVIKIKKRTMGIRRGTGFRSLATLRRAVGSRTMTGSANGPVEETKAKSKGIRMSDGRWRWIRGTNELRDIDITSHWTSRQGCC
jgi:hypothetical protein